MPARPAASPRIGPPIDASRRQTLRRGLLVTLGARPNAPTVTAKAAIIATMI